VAKKSINLGIYLFYYTGVPYSSCLSTQHSPIASRPIRSLHRLLYMGLAVAIINFQWKQTAVTLMAARMRRLWRHWCLGCVCYLNDAKTLNRLQVSKTENRERPLCKAGLIADICKLAKPEW